MAHERLEARVTEVAEAAFAAQRFVAPVDVLVGLGWLAPHTGARGSGRVGRTAAARGFDSGALTVAVAASVRHEDTRYDELLMSYMGRDEARERVGADVERMLDRWRVTLTEAARDDARGEESG